MKKMNKKNTIITVLSVLVGTTTATAIAVPLILMDQNKKSNFILEKKYINDLHVSPKFDEFYSKIGNLPLDTINTIINATSLKEKMTWVYVTNPQNQVINGISSVKSVEVKKVGESSQAKFEVVFNDDYKIEKNLSNIVVITNKKIIDISWKATANAEIQKLILDNSVATASEIESLLNIAYGGSSIDLQKIIDIPLPNLVTSAKFFVETNVSGNFDVSLKDILLNSDQYVVKKIDPLTNISVKLTWTDMVVTNDYVRKFFSGKSFVTNNSLVAEVQEPVFKNYLKVLIQQNNLITNLETKVEQNLTDKALISNLIVSVNIKGYDKPITLPTIENIPAQLIINLEFKSEIKLYLEQIIKESKTAGNTLELVKEIFALPENITSVFNHLTDTSKLQVINNGIILLVEGYTNNNQESNQYDFLISFRSKQNFSAGELIQIKGVRGKTTTL